MAIVFQILFILCSVLILPPPDAQAQTRSITDDRSAVVLAYYRVDEDNFPNSHIRFDQFKAHIDELQAQDYNIVPLDTIVEAIRSGRNLAPKTIALTFEGGYKSPSKQAFPLLIERGLPFTVFYATVNATSSSQQYLGWDDLQQLAENDEVSFGLHPSVYKHLYDIKAADLLSHINAAKAAHRGNLGTPPVLFSYPYGEWTPEFQSVLKEQGFKAATSIQSGALHSPDQLFHIPRFTMTEKFARLDRFRQISQALPLYASDVTPQGSLVETPSPALGFTLHSDLAGDAAKLSCHVSGQDKPELQYINQTRVELRLSEPLTLDRTRVNCTLPVYEDGDLKTWRWFGMVLTHDDLR